MANIILNNPEGCCCKERLKRFDNDCRACYFSQVNKKNQWVGSQKCYNQGECLVYGGQK